MKYKENEKIVLLYFKKQNSFRLIKMYEIYTNHNKAKITNSFESLSVKHYDKQFQISSSNL